jgi:RimJ/RimL family protein N-acetyltransferase
MTEKLLKIAENEGIHKIELTVVADNKSATSLYKKFRFKVEGVSKDSFYGNDEKYHDIVHMGLIL